MLLELAVWGQEHHKHRCQLRINVPKVYDGKLRPLADQFMQQIKVAAEFETFRNECQKILWAQSYLTRSAQDWSSVIMTGLDDPVANPKHFQWQAWRDNFRAAFCMHDLAQDALACLGQLQQGSKSIMDYCTMFLELKGKLGNVDMASKYIKDCF